jgi:hypothetical protein
VMDETYSISDVRAMSAGQPDVLSLDAVRAMQAGDSSLTDTHGRALTNGGAPAAAYKVAEAMGTPEGRAEAVRLGLGALRGASDIGDTLLNGGAWLADKLTPGGAPNLVDANRQREASLNQFFDERIPQGNVSAGVGRLGMNVAGTAGVGPALAAPVRALGGSVPAISALANAIESGGMATGASLARTAPVAARVGDMALRVGGGALTGAASAGLISPSSAPSGALVGAALPPVIAGLGSAGKAVNAIYRSASIPRDARLARDMAGLAGVNTQNLDELAQMRDALRQQGPSLIPGAEPTVPQIVQTPGMSQLQRSVKAANPTLLNAREAEQSAARSEALNRIAPVSGTAQQAAEDAGNAISTFAIPARQAEAQRVSEMFDAVDTAGEARFQLPIDRMEQAQARYLGPGTFGSGKDVRAAIKTAQELSQESASAEQPRLVTFDEVQNLRSSLNETWNQAKLRGNAREAAALQQMIRDVDQSVKAVSQGHGAVGEYFPPDTVQRWKDAIAAHAAKKVRFDTGPQAAMFRQGGDGMPLVQGAEIPSKFFGASRSQVENAQAFRRLVADDPQLMGDLRRYAVTDAAGQVDQFGNLTNAKFNRWLAARSGATGEIFSEPQRAILKAIGDDLRRAASAESLGRSSGSDTAQKAASMLRLGLLDSPTTNYAASRMPGGRAVLDYFRGPAQAARAQRLGGLLADPERTAGLLDTYILSQQPTDMGLLNVAADPMLYRTAPLLLTAPSR